MKAFISYGDAADQVTALRLLGLGVANGVIVCVPPAHTRQSIPGVSNQLDPESAQKLREAEVVLGVVGTGLTEACRQQLNRPDSDWTVIAGSFPADAMLGWRLEAL